ncbi:TIGR00730 family Rossman fold protein [Aeromicrobium sp. CF3.5]|uniref:LOG family protein n=1 Tax=Aeromicrobium sp. CF3.5 TaxID=3373078 RepID=UPI003EE525FC
MSLSSVAVFCGSRFGNDPAYADLARHTGRTLAERGLTVVYGGGHVGLMGVVADAALEAGGRVIGVIPRQLHDREVSHSGVTELRVVESMHERKQVMADLSDVFVALPGGVGTVEEITEQWTWAQLGIHAKPSAFLDLPDTAGTGDGFWSPMRLLIDQLVGHGFVAADESSIPVFVDDLGAFLDNLDARA